MAGVRQTSFLRLDYHVVAQSEFVLRGAIGFQARRRNDWAHRVDGPGCRRGQMNASMEMMAVVTQSPFPAIFPGVCCV